jgi:hypothetical protein
MFRKQRKTYYSSDGRPICWYDEKCERKDKGHFLKYSHPVMSLKFSNFVPNKYEVVNGLLGVKRDTFLLLIGYMSLENNDNKTRNVRKFLFYTDLLMLYDVISLDDRDMFTEFCLDYSLSFHHIKNETKINS